MVKKSLRQFSIVDLLDIAIKAIKCNRNYNPFFKEFFEVDFSYLQLCNYLVVRNVITKTEYEQIKLNQSPEEQLLFFEEIRKDYIKKSNNIDEELYWCLCNNRF